MKKAAIFLVLVLWVSLSLFSAATPVQDARFLEKEIRYTVHADGSWEKEYRHRLRLDSYNSFNAMYGETFIVYNPDFQTLDILKSETVMKDGKKVASPANAFNEVLPADAHNFVHLSHMREMVVTHIGLECGAVVELHYRLKTKPGFMPWFSTLERVCEDAPVDSLVVHFDVPASTPLQYGLFNLTAQPEIKKDDSKKEAVFIWKNLPAYNAAIFLGEKLRASLVFSTAPGWDAIFPNNDVLGALPEQLLKAAQELKTANPHEDEFLFLLQEMFQQALTTCSMSVKDSGLLIRPAETIYRSGYATELEKTLFLVRLLKELNYPSQIVGLPMFGHIQENVPAPEQLGSLSLAVKKSNGETVFIDPLQAAQRFDSIRPDMENACFFGEKTFRKLAASESDRNAVSVSGKLEVEKEKVSGELTVIISGSFLPYRTALRDANGAVNQVLADFFPGAKKTVKKLLGLNPDRLTAIVAVEGELFGKDFKDRVTLNRLGLPDFLDGLLIRLSSVSYPVMLRFPAQVEYRVDLKTPKEWGVVFAIPAAKAANAVGSYQRSVTVGPDGLISLRLNTTFSKAALQVADFPFFKELVNEHLGSGPWMILKIK